MISDDLAERKGRLLVSFVDESPICQRLANEMNAIHGDVAVRGVVSSSPISRMTLSLLKRASCSLVHLLVARVATSLAAIIPDYSLASGRGQSAARRESSLR